MLDIHVRAQPATDLTHSVDFFRIELAPLAEGRVGVSMTATTLDEEGADLLDQEIARDNVASIDDMLAFIRTHVTFVARSSDKEQ